MLRVRLLVVRFSALSWLWYEWVRRLVYMGGHSLFWHRCYFLSLLKKMEKERGGFGDFMGLRVVSSR